MSVTSSEETGNVAASSPAASDGIVVVNIERIDPPRDRLTARSTLTGDVIWSFADPQPIFGRNLGPDSSPTITRGVVYVGFPDRVALAVDATDGTLLWKGTLDGYVLSSPSVTNGQMEMGTVALARVGAEGSNSRPSPAQRSKAIERRCAQVLASGIGGAAGSRRR
jgi:PQQ enzyme-like repeat protein